MWSPLNDPYLINPEGRNDGFTKVVTVGTSQQLDIALGTVSPVHKKIRVEFDLLIGAGAGSIKFLPNGIADATNTGEFIQKIYFGLGPSFAAGRVTEMTPGSPAEADSTQCRGWFEFSLHGATRRYFESRSVSWTSTTPRTERDYESAGMSTYVTTLTSVRILSAYTNILTGSTLIARWA